MPPDLRRGLSAMVASAWGTLAGILVDSGYGLRESVVTGLYRLLRPLFDLFSAFPNDQLALAGFIYRVPGVVAVGMLTGLLLRYFRYPQLVVWATLVWLAWLAGQQLVPGLVLLPSGADGRLWHTVRQIRSELVLYCMQYALLIIVILGTNRAVARSANPETALKSG